MSVEQTISGPYGTDDWKQEIVIRDAKQFYYRQVSSYRLSVRQAVRFLAEYEGIAIQTEDFIEEMEQMGFYCPEAHKDRNVILQKALGQGCPQE